MAKLIAQYVANPTQENARKVATYRRKHPMAECMLTTEQWHSLNQILTRAE